MARSKLLGAVLVMILGAADTAGGQCTPDWLPGEGPAGVDGNGAVMASTLWDPDGAGPQQPLLVVAGNLWSAGDVRANGIAAWDGKTWRALGQGVGGVQALAVYNGELIAGTSAAVGGVLRFDQASGNWSPLGGGVNHAVRALTVYNGELIAAGFFTAAGGQPANHIARWNGATWSGLGGGTANVVVALTVQNGSLIAGGQGVYRWTGASWQALGPSISVEALTVYDGSLIAGGAFRVVEGGPANHVARWDGQAWQPLGTGMDDGVKALAVYKNELIAGGIFRHADGGPVAALARWDGTSWNSVAGGGAGQIWMLQAYRGELVIGGTIPGLSGLPSAYVARFNGVAWNTLGTGMDGPVLALAEFNGDLYAGGWFGAARGVEATGILRRRGTGPGSAWEPLGSGLSGGDGIVVSLAVHRATLIVSGSFTSAGGVPASGMARWNGTEWIEFPSAAVSPLLEHNSELYGAGNFPPSGVGRWDGTIWQPIGVMPPASSFGVAALAVHNGALIAGGIAGIGATTSVYRWDGAAWQPMGPPLSAIVRALESYDGFLYAGGDFGIVRWDGAAWQPLPGGLSPQVFDLLAYRGELIVAGNFQPEPGSPIRNIGRWNGGAWAPLGGGIGIDATTMDDPPAALLEHNGELIVGGWFTVAGGQPNVSWAHWGCACYPNCDGSTQPPVLNVSDFTCFLNKYAAGDAYANCDGSTAPPILNVNDFTCFLSRFAAGCS